MPKKRSGTTNTGKKIIKMKIEFLKFDTIQNNIEAFSIKRSKVRDYDTYSGFNICDYTGDSTSHTEKCKSELCNLFGINTDNLVMPRQTHSTNTLIIDSAFINASKEKRISLLQDKDALITSIENIIIGINTADCVPVLFYEPLSGIIAAAHAGWKGTVNKIVQKTLSGISSLGGNIITTQVILGPSICRECFEVGSEVTDKFYDAGFPMNHILHKSPRTNKLHIDLLKANNWLLAEKGVPQNNITVSGICTKCNPSEYFSARSCGIKSGRIFSGILRRRN